MGRPRCLQPWFEMGRLRAPPHHEGENACTRVRFQSLARSSELGLLKSGNGNPACMQAARTVLASRQEIVIGPTPPGTGVIAPATSLAPAKATSPTSFDLPGSPGT